MKPKEKLSILTIATSNLIGAVESETDKENALQQAKEAVGHFVEGSKKKQPTRLIKAICGGCGYNVRITRVWLEIAAPTCPNKNCDHFGKEMMHETDATTKEERVNEYHTQQENSLKRLVTQETGKVFKDSVRERGTYRGKTHNQAYNKPDATEQDADWQRYLNETGADDLTCMNPAERNTKKGKGKK